jgi:hypothetical protein
MDPGPAHNGFCVTANYAFLTASPDPFGDAVRKKASISVISVSHDFSKLVCPSSDALVPFNLRHPSNARNAHMEMPLFSVQSKREHAQGVSL